MAGVREGEGGDKPQEPSRKLLVIFSRLKPHVTLMGGGGRRGGATGEERRVEKKRK